MSSSSPTAATPSPLEAYGLAELAHWERAGVSLAVLGHPVAHSVSPQMHNAALAEMRARRPELAGWTYFKFDVEPERLKPALRWMNERGFRGVNLTVPHKVQVLPLLDDMDDEACAMGAVNTLLARPEGGWRGHNTDGYGLAQALRRDLGVELKGAAVVLLGAGGAARGAAIQCLREGCDTLWIGNRSLDKLDDLLIQLVPQDRDERARGFDLSKPPVDEWPADVVVVNATSVGLKPEDPAPFDVTLLGGAAHVLDMIYRRDGATPLVAAARAHGLRAADGLGMLVWQGVRSLEIWTGATAPAQTMMDAACRALGLPPRHV
jgi:shikimate dehydrogenase